VPDLGTRLLPIVVGATALFEIVGPLLTRRALRAMHASRSEGAEA
jgi:hypothetical protein